jgi:hypothetical protein
MQPHSFSKRQLSAIALMLDEDEKSAALSDKKKNVCGFTSVSEAENQKDRMEEIAMEGFLHIQNLGNI